MAAKVLLVTGNRKRNIPAGITGLIENLLKEAGYDGQFTCVLGDATKGSAHIQGITVRTFDQGRNTVTLRVQPGSNDTSRVVYLTCPAQIEVLGFFNELKAQAERLAELARHPPKRQVPRPAPVPSAPDVPPVLVEQAEPLSEGLTEQQIRSAIAPSQPIPSLQNQPVAPVQCSPIDTEIERLLGEFSGLEDKKKVLKSQVTDTFLIIDEVRANIGAKLEELTKVRAREVQLQQGLDILQANLDENERCNKEREGELASLESTTKELMSKINALENEKRLAEITASASKLFANLNPDQIAVVMAAVQKK